MNEVELVLRVVEVQEALVSRGIDDPVDAERGDAERTAHLAKAVAVAQLVQRPERVSVAHSLRTISSASSRVNARKRLGVLGAVAVELHQDLDRHLVVGSLEDLDDVVAAECDVHADERSSGAFDDPLALLDPLAPARQSGEALRRPAHERDVVRHVANICRRAPQRVSRASRRRLAPPRRRADQGRPRRRERRARTAEHLRRARRHGRGRRTARLLRSD